jgi:hypothetical protein
MDAGIVTIGEQSDGDFFYFKRREMGASVLAVQVGVEAHQRTSRRNEHPTYCIFDQDNISSIYIHNNKEVKF